jgi:hypothetical protein
MGGACQHSWSDHHSLCLFFCGVKDLVAFTLSERSESKGEGAVLPRPRQFRLTGSGRCVYGCVRRDEAAGHVAHVRQWQALICRRSKSEHCIAQCSDRKLFLWSEQTIHCIDHIY